jgi:site-specific DNA recombinase
MRSPYLLSGLITCGRCGHRYQGRVTNSTKRRQDGSKIRTLYYACGGYVMKGTSTCQKFLLQKEPLERFVEGLVADKVQALIRGEGIDILEKHVAGGEAARNRARREAARLRACVVQIEKKASLLLEGLTEDTQDFVNGKLRELATDKRRFQRQLQELESNQQTSTDAPSCLEQGLQTIRELPRRLTEARLPEHKAFISDFVVRIIVLPDERSLEVRIRKIPNSLLTAGGFHSFTAQLLGSGPFRPRS